MGIDITLQSLERALGRFTPAVARFIADMPFVFRGDAEHAAYVEAMSALDDARSSTAVVADDAHTWSPRFRASLERLGFDVSSWVETSSGRSELIGTLDHLGAEPLRALAGLAVLDRVPESLDALVDSLSTSSVGPIGRFDRLVGAMVGTLIVPIRFEETLDVVACSIASAFDIRAGVRALVGALPIARSVGVDRFVADLEFASIDLPKPLGAALHDLAQIDRVAERSIATGLVGLVDG